MTFAMPSLRVYRATDDLAREIAGRIKRFGLVMLGFAIIIAGIAIAPLPGPGGIPVIVVGLMVVLKNSFKARRQFVRLHRAHPKVLSPIRRLLRRDPEFMALFYQQTLRVERVMVPRRLRFVKPLRRRFRRR
ncbi:MAG: PGPGW domain-containing protein [Phenylobacterium sp.]|nr:PGPGW domain-containing protein [Phenylobacterium sp.]